MNFILAQIFAFIAISVGIISFQLKEMKYILISQLISNGMMVFNYALLGGLSGAGISIIAIFQAFATYIFNKKEKKIPWFVIGIFMICYIACSLMALNTAIDLLPCLAALTFAISLVQEKSSIYRICMLLNILLWVGYDVNYKAYASLLGRLVMFVSVVSAMIRIDYKEYKNKKDVKAK